ncbi:hypothetical protein A3A14_02205 [Candidatus Daviesbacteria bacterium RIFCSPLOWO2_01_FULL_43_38]|nr:MAG: hypothetical protein A2874_04180 [Candidatus Daviesbacteria bacterium RIFCSPHIGHO2_01_FULL_43_17]OGE63849.1 MAG: hypothetical protein A3A14_02205 [Candidatus Daviesbacteria bacterium RIFCSPLOWO2_01_FULL_43_38]
MVELIQSLNTQVFFQMFNLGGTSPLLRVLAVFGAEYLIFLIFTIVGLAGLLGKLEDRKALVLVILAIPFAAIFTKIIPLIISEPRPFTTFPIVPLIDRPATPSFPSLHATWTASAAFGLIFYKTRFALLLLIFMLWVGLSRIFVGVHYPLDVLGGFLVGFLAVFLAWQTKNFIGRRLT